MTLYQRIKQRREELGMTQEELAQKMGYKSRSSINKIETGENDIPQSKIKLFADILETTPAYLMGWESTKSSESVAGRILAIMKYKKISLLELAQRLDIPQSDLYSFIYQTPDSEFDYNDQKLYNIAQALEISYDALWGYNTFGEDDYENYIGSLLNKIAQGLPLTPTENQKVVDYLNDDYTNAPYYPDNIIPMPKTKEVPLLGDIACGEPLLAQENIESYIKIDETIPADFALRCKGDSMINARVFDGDIVYIRQQPDVENGEIAAVLIGNEATLKKVHKFPNKLVLSACNPMYDDFIYTDEQLADVRIIGKAVAFLSVFR